MPAEVRIGGYPINAIATVSELQDSTRWTTKLFDNDPSGWSGDYQCQFSWAADERFNAPWFRIDADVAVIESGKRTWGGRITSLDSDENGWKIVATGYGYALSLWQAFEADSTAPAGTAPVKPSFNADNAVDYTHDFQSMPVDRWDNSLGVITMDPDGPTRTLEHLLNLVAKGRGKRHVTDSFGEIALFDDPTAPTWMLAAGTTYLGTPDDQFYTHMWGRFVNGLDANGEPNDWRYVLVSDEEMAAQNGRREVMVDLTPLGLITSAAALMNVQNRFKLVGARMGWTNAVQLGPTSLWHITGAPVSPLAMWGANGAGTILRIPGAADNRSTPTTRPTIDLLLGEVTRFHETGQVTAKPVGFAGRDFASAIQAAQRPQEDVAA